MFSSTTTDIISFSVVSPTPRHASGVIRPDPLGRYLASADKNGTILIWDLKSGKQYKKLNAGTAVYGLGFDPTGNYLASGSADSNVRVWELESGKQISKYSHMGIVHHVNIDPTGKIRLSRQAVLEGWTVEEAIEKDRSRRRPSGNRGRDRRRGGGRNR